MDGEAWWATVHGVAKSRTRLSDFTHYVFISMVPVSKPSVLMFVFHHSNKSLDSFSFLSASVWCSELYVGGESVVPSVGVVGGSGHPRCWKGKETRFECSRSSPRPGSPSHQVGGGTPQGALAHSGCEWESWDPVC